jgi:DNA-directed RNA polymerase specialized sigma24 family protein
VPVSPLVLANGKADSSTQAPARAWPRTQADEWCGEWDGGAEVEPQRDAALPVCQDIATRTFLGRIAPTLDAPNPAVLLEALLNQLPPDVRRVIVRMNGLDGQALSGLKEVARDFRMSREQVRALLAAGEKKLSEVIGQLAARRAESWATPPRSAAAITEE